MGKLSGLPASKPKAPKAKIRSKSSTPDILTAQGGAGFSRKPKSELFLLAVTNMVGEDTFYEGRSERDQRFVDLIHKVAVDDPDWLARFVPYLRNTMNMRSASVVMAAETVHAKLTRPVPSSKVSNRAIIASALMRADEPAELIGYWRSRYGRSLPMPVKRGISDAVQRLYTERSAIKHDGTGQAIRFADVIEIVHAEPKAAWQSALFHYLIDERHGHAVPFGEDGTYRAPEEWGESDRVRGYGLKTLPAHAKAMALTSEQFREAFSADLVDSAGLTWETASSKYGKLDAKFWEAMVPNMGVFALTRNLRNIEQANVSKETLDKVRTRLESPMDVAASRMFPMRFLSAYKATGTLTFARELETALDLSTQNAPALDGKTVVLIDVSGSMIARLSAKSDLQRWEAAAVFGAAVLKRNPQAKGYLFADRPLVEVMASGGASVLRMVEAIRSSIGGGTNIVAAAEQALALNPDAKRMIVLTDEQASVIYSMRTGWGSPMSVFNSAIQSTPQPTLAEVGIPIFTFNLAGYKAGWIDSGKDNRYTFGGLTDAAFSMIPLLESGHDADWPF